MNIESKPTDEANKPQKKNWVKTTAGRIGLSVLVLGGLGGGVYEAYQHLLPLHETTNNPIRNPFPYELDTSSFPTITQSQAEEQLKNGGNIADVENHNITMFLPISKETLDKTPIINYNQVFIADLPPYVDMAELKNVKNVVQIDGLPDGTTVRAPAKGMLRVLAIAGQKFGTGNNTDIPSYSEISIAIQDKDGKTLWISISILGGEPLLDLSQATWESKGIEIKTGQPLFRISKNNAVGGKALGVENGQIVIRAAYDQQNPRAPIPLTINFFKEIIAD